MFDLDKLAPTIAQTISKQIVEGITDEDRDKVLSLAVAQALEGWSFKSAVEKAVAARASQLSSEYLLRPHAEERLRAAIERGFEMYVEALPAKIFEGLCKLMHGQNDPKGYCHQAGTILRLLEAKG